MARGNRSNPDEIQAILAMLNVPIGATIEPSAVSDRLFTVTSKRHAVASHLQRTGKLVWLAKAEPYVIAAGSARPMVRLVVANRDGLDLTGPANTKRITATTLTRRDPALRARP